MILSRKPPMALARIFFPATAEWIQTRQHNAALLAGDRQARDFLNTPFAGL